MYRRGQRTAVLDFHKIDFASIHSYLKVVFVKLLRFELLKKKKT